MTSSDPSQNVSDGASRMGDSASPTSPISQTPMITLKDGSRIPGDPSWYTWSRLFRCYMGGCTNSEVLEYAHMDSIYKGGSKCRKCEKDRDWLLKYSPIVIFMKDKLKELDVDVTKKSFSCRVCNIERFNDATMHAKGGGGFKEGHPISICANLYDGTRGRLEDIMTHEMVHAYDYARFKVDPNNIKHQACTEIRANLLSGECRFAREFFNNPNSLFGINLKFKMHFQDCVRRRAVWSLVARGHQDITAVKAVNSVWDNCFRDTRPFDEVYR